MPGMNRSTPPTLPIPPEQRPINEYQELRGSYFFRWATLEPRTYLSGILFVWLAAWFISGPVSAWSFPPQRMTAQFILGGAGGAGIILGLVLMRLYLGWGYIYSRLLSPRVHYEETGWHDGSFWIKPEEELAKDRLVVQYRVNPILRRLRRTLGTLGMLGLAVLGAWWLI